MRVQMKFGRETVIALKKVKELLYGDANIEITNGYVIGIVYSKIKSNIENIDWENLSDNEYLKQIINDDKITTSTKTTINIQSSVNDGINNLQIYFKSLFKNERFHKSYVVKLMLFAMIVELEKS